MQIINPMYSCRFVHKADVEAIVSRELQDESRESARLFDCLADIENL